MCLIVFAWRAHPDYPLIFAGNRDEFYTRRTRPAAWWGQAVSLLAGQDEEAGGTWFGITRRGRVATLTNVRALPSAIRMHRRAAHSCWPRCRRRSASTVGSIGIRIGTPVFNGFNLIAGDLMPAGGQSAGSLHYFSNRLGTRCVRSSLVSTGCRMHFSTRHGRR